MIKCSKCNTLYAESATICLYCKIPLESNTSYDEKYFNFKIKEFETEIEAKEYKVTLLASDIPCVIRKDENKFSVLIPENAKKGAFKPNESSLIDSEFGNTTPKSGNAKVTFYLAFLLIFLIICFIFYFSKSGKELFLRDVDSKDKIIYEEGTVDTRIIDKKSRLSPEKESKPKGKPKVENPVPR